MLSWEDEVAREEVAQQRRDVQNPWGKPRPRSRATETRPVAETRVVEPRVVQRSLTPEARPSRRSPWEVSEKEELKVEPKPSEIKTDEMPTVSTYAAVSKGERVSPVPSPVGVPSVAPKTVPKGPWGVKNPRITSKAPYSQVASSNVNQPATTQPETKSGGTVGMVTMSLKPRTAMRN